MLCAVFGLRLWGSCDLEPLTHDEGTGFPSSEGEVRQDKRGLG